MSSAGKQLGTQLLLLETINLEVAIWFTMLIIALTLTPRLVRTTLLAVMQFDLLLEGKYDGASVVSHRL